MADVDEAKGNAASAQTLLENAYQHAGNDAFKTLAGLYLARIEIAQKKADDALKLLDGLSALGYSSLRDELRGDALAALGKKDEARTAYTDALTNLDPNAPNRSFIEMKRNDLGSEEKKGS
jgi:predicted negative regulator of RcsB-dependent stress response